MDALFSKLLEKVKGFMSDEDGQTLVEYALILVLIAIVVLFFLTALGENVNNTFNIVNSALER